MRRETEAGSKTHRCGLISKKPVGKDAERSRGGIGKMVGPGGWGKRSRACSQYHNKRISSVSFSLSLFHPSSSLFISYGSH